MRTKKRAAFTPYVGFIHVRFASTGTVIPTRGRNLLRELRDIHYIFTHTIQ